MKRICGATLGIGLCFVAAAGTCAPQAPVAPAHAEATPALAARINDIAQHPGQSMQMCGVIIARGFTISFPGFSREPAMIAPAQLRELRKERGATIDALRRALDYRTTEPAPAPQRQVDSNSGSVYYISVGSPEKYRQPSFVYGSELLMTMDLNASELLEDLIRQAERLKPAPRPETSDEQHTAMLLTRETDYVATLSAIATLLYNEGAPEMIGSEFVKAWDKQLDEIAELHRLLPMDTLSSDAMQNGHWAVDARRHIAVAHSAHVYLAATPERADQLIAWAKAFCARVPAARRLGARGMSEYPSAR